jgi:predicted ester cyclase
MMKALAMESKELMTEYFRDLSGKPKTEELLDRYISDPALKEHIREVEAAFPEYTLEVQEMITEGDMVAVRGTVRGMHKGVYAGIPPTGRQLNLEVMVFYRISDGRISKYWLQTDSKVLMDQLTG